MENHMETDILKSKIHETIEMLPPAKMLSALELLRDLQKSDERETQDLLDIPGFIQEYRKAKEDIRSGNTVSWDKIKRNV